MKNLSGLLLVSLLTVVIIAQALADQIRDQKSTTTTPAPTTENDPWFAITTKLHLSSLKKESPELFERITQDASHPAWLGLWGKSVNFDELSQAVIVSPAIIHTLLELFHLPEEAHAVHAGVEHIYGYLFSNLQTPYGYKRARWVRQTLDLGFGLPTGTLSPLPPQGTLFSNVTYFAGRIAFRGEKDSLRVLDDAPSYLSPAIKTYDFASLKPMRLEETIQTSSGDVTLRTDLLAFPKSVRGDKNTHWLIYSIRDRRNGAPQVSQLITAFPVESSFIKVVFKTENLGENKPIITRYNAYVAGITGTEHSGARQKR